MAWLQRIFSFFYSERQFYMRHEGQVHFISVSPNAQIGISVMLLCFLLWTTYSSALVFFQQDHISLLNKKVVLLQSVYEERLAEMQENHDALNARLSLAKEYFQKTTENLEERHKHIATIMGVRDKMGLEIRKRRQELRRAREKGKGLAPKDLEGRIFPKPHNGKEIAFLDLSSRPIDSSTILPSTKGWEPGRWLDHEKRLQDWRYILSSDGETVEGKTVDTILPTLHAIGLVQTAILDHFEESTKEQILSYEEAIHVIAMMDSDDLIKKFATSDTTPPQSLGGPFIPLATKPVGATTLGAATLGSETFGTESNSFSKFPSLNQRITNLRTMMNHLDNLQESFLRLPIAPPMDGYHITSNFGPRMDPFTQRWASHLGVDMISSKKAKVLAVLPGEVTFAGKKSSFGNMVEIEHESGVKTRYGHLKEIMVKKKDKVDFRTILGIVGNSGRSTGEHLHFEILLDDEAQDPLKFLEAGKYVFKIEI